LKKITIVLIVAIAASMGLAAMPAFPSVRAENPAPAASIVGGSNITLVARQSSFPVVVNNNLDSEVRVIVHLVSNSPKLIVEETTDWLVMQPGTTVNAQFPVSAIGSGDVVMVAWLTSISGVDIGPKVQIKLTVNPDIETWAIGLFFGLVAVLTVVGFIRTSRRSRSS
jgi:hypothetical protein